MAGRFALPTPSAYDSSGNPLAGGKLEFYESGTSTPLDTYSDDALSTANANPVVADSAGRWDDIFLKDQDYKVILKSSADVTIDTWDPVRAAEPRSSAVISKTTTYTVLVSDAGKLITADATAGAFTITLPAAATAGDGFEVSVIKVDSSANAVTVDGDGSETINGDTSLDLASQFDATLLRSDGTSWHAIVEPTSTTTPVPRGYIDGLQLSNDASDTDHDVEIASGVARDDGNNANMDVSAAFTKRIDAAWAVGDTNGGLDTGAVGNNTWYHVWLIRRSDTGVVDALFSTSATAPTMPSNYDQKRRIGAVLTDGSANILAFTAKELSGGGVHFSWDDPPLDINVSNPGTSAVLRTLSTPLGLKTEALINVYSLNESGVSNGATYISDPDVNDEAVSTTAAPLGNVGTPTDNAVSSLGQLLVFTNTSSQVRSRALASSTNTGLKIATLGWRDHRRV